MILPQKSTNLDIWLQSLYNDSDFEGFLYTGIILSGGGM